MPDSAETTINTAFPAAARASASAAMLRQRASVDTLVPPNLSTTKRACAASIWAAGWASDVTDLQGGNEVRDDTRGPCGRAAEPWRRPAIATPADCARNG